MTIVIDKSRLLSTDIGWEFEGTQFSDAKVSFIIIDAPPGTGPKLHSHPYEEIFIVQEGQVTFTVGDATMEATAGQIVIAPANTPHKFINTGATPLRQVDIHASPRFITTWLED